MKERLTARARRDYNAYAKEAAALASTMRSLGRGDLADEILSLRNKLLAKTSAAMLRAESEGETEGVS